MYTFPVIGIKSLGLLFAFNSIMLLTLNVFPHFRGPVLFSIQIGCLIPILNGRFPRARGSGGGESRAEGNAKRDRLDKCYAQLKPEATSSYSHVRCTGGSSLSTSSRGLIYAVIWNKSHRNEVLLQLLRGNH